MPTAEVVAAFESLLGSVINMLDMKKMTDKLDGEIKVLEAQKAERERRERRDRGEFTPEGDGDVEGGEAGETEAEVTVKGEEQEEALVPEPEPEPEEKGTLAPSTRAGSVGMHKRSASVLSQISDKSSKRQRK
jgi:DNA methyltransferase 1-associated protein 1